MILVTGGTGMVGAHLLYKLLNEEQNIRAIYRNKKKFEIVKRIFSYYNDNTEALFNKIEWILADLNDIPSLNDAFKDVTHVYHCAAFVSFEPDKFYLLKKTNIEGTANIVNLCLANKTQKLCYVSSIAAIGSSKNNEPITEETDWNPEKDNSVYAITKYGAEMEVWRGTQEGLNAVIVNPGIILGPGIWKYGSGGLFTRIYKGLPFYTKGVTGYVSVNDVVNAMIGIMQSHIINERFILVSENLSFETFTKQTAIALGVKQPKKEAKQWHLNLFWRFDWLRHKLVGKRRQMSKHNAQSATTKDYYNNDKIIKALGFKFMVIAKSIENVASYFLEDQKN
ncbi:NAD-dependent epimerase/dehydratase family protein [uncultured Lacinutrix sp.]|uniref:NAD-dependent epimerase/dehydratase family protein n=1 Tax=uncultured Lacinutrix sp. TaxID=574032 RepID=UPI00262BE1FC|nr:NAD-dependent epimerase/dehydratase family protein [uncultured Lacinutrix sp.]